MASRAERNIATGSMAAAQVASTCPWGASEAGSTPSSRQPSGSRSTCPWSKDGNEAPAAKREPHVNKPSKDTCPWSSNASDKDSARLAEAARRRQVGSGGKFNGCAGSGAPKVGAPAAAPERVEVAPGFGAQAPQAPMTFNDGVELSEDEEQEEQRELIQQCLAQGLDEEQILEMLDNWQNQKLIQATQDKLRAQQPEAQGICAHERTARPNGFTPEPLGLSGASIAASRQAKAKKSLSFGPDDAEIVNVLKDYSKENLTPPESPPNSVTIAAKRQKDREPSEASLGAFDSTKSRAAYLQSKAQMDAAKNKNRQSPGIFG